LWCFNVRDEKASGKKSDLSGIHTFGCRVWIKHTRAKSKKYNAESKKGQHLGHLPGSTWKNSFWVDDTTGRVKLGYHLRFNEGMNKLALAELPPNMKISSTPAQPHQSKMLLLMKTQTQ
jgi:hypothetical protein